MAPSTIVWIGTRHDLITSIALKAAKILPPNELIWRYIQQKRNHIKPYNLTLFKTYLQYDNIDVNRATFMSTLYNRRNEFALQSGGSNIYHNYMENKKLYNILM